MIKKITLFFQKIKEIPELIRSFLARLQNDLSLKERFMILGLLFIFFTATSWFLVGYYISHSKVAPAQGGIFIEGLVGKFEYINPVLAPANDVDQDITKLVFSGLMKYDHDNNLVNDIAENLEVSDDKTEYRIKIKENVTFHDGKSLTAEDVRFTVELIKNKRYNSRLRYDWTDIELPEVINEHELVFKLEKPFTPFPHNLTFGILPKHIWDDVKPQDFQLSTYNKTPIGSGPYQYSRPIKDDNGLVNQLVFKKYDDYYLKKPYIETILFKFYPTEEDAIEALNNEEVLAINNVSHQNIDQINTEEIDIKEISWPLYYTIFLNSHNTDYDYIADKEVREALAYATCKDKIIEEVLYGKGMKMNSPIMNISMEGVEDFKERGCDTKKAIDILEEAGWDLEDYVTEEEEESDEADEEDNEEVEEDEDEEEETEDEEASAADEEEHEAESEEEESTEEEKEKVEAKQIFYNKKDEPLVIKITLPDYPKLIETAEVIKRQWEEAGVAVEIEVLSIGDLQRSKIETREYAALLYFEIYKVDPDPRAYWHSSQKKGSGLNLAVYDNEKADEFLDKGREEINEEVRKKIYQDFQLEINEDIPAIFLYSPYYLYPVNKEVKGIDVDSIGMPSNRYDNVSDWYLKEKRIID
jgi:peptide/nickel transport system substrate-binding protein